VSPGGTGLCRQAVPHRNPENYITQMSRLAVVHRPPGGFWKISKNMNFNEI